MSFWENPPDLVNMAADKQEFGRVWQAAQKIIYSKTLKTVTAKNIRIESILDVQKIREMKTNLSHDICIGGPTLAGLQFVQNWLMESKLLLYQ